MTGALVIPARWGSTRLPGKPLRQIAGHSLLSRVVYLAKRGIAHRPNVALIVATDDERIARHAETLGCLTVMTDPSIDTGSARALAAASKLPARPDFIVNLQGDAPFTAPGTVAAVLDEAVAGRAETDVVTAAVPLTWAALDDLRRHKIVAPFSGTTCIVAPDGHARWFSKQVIPSIRGEAERRLTEVLSPVYRHVGLYGYTYDALRRFVALPAGTYEQLEGLEQLRLIENDMSIRVVKVAEQAIGMGGIDTPHDVALAEKLIARSGDPMDQ